MVFKVNTANIEYFWIFLDIQITQDPLCTAVLTTITFSWLLLPYQKYGLFFIVCLSKTFLNSSIETNDDKIWIDGYNLIRADHPSDYNKSGVYIHYKEHIPLIKKDNIYTLDDCLVTEIRSQGEECFLTCIYCSTSQGHDEFVDFCSKFDLLLSNINNEFPLCSVITRDFNAHCWRWWHNDITNSAGQEIDSLTLSAGFKQIVDNPTHVVNNSISCIALLFCTKQNAILNYGVGVSIYDKCHHNIIFCKINIRVSLPPVYIHEVWDYSQVNVENIKYVISNFNWSKAFENLPVDGKVKHLNETLLRIFRNYVLNKNIKCDYYQPLWINDNTEISLKQRSKLTKIFYKNGLRKSDSIKVLEKSTECTKKIFEAKKIYI